MGNSCDSIVLFLCQPSLYVYLFVWMYLQTPLLIAQET